MSKNREALLRDTQQLLSEGVQIFQAELHRRGKGGVSVKGKTAEAKKDSELVEKYPLHQSYQAWYSKALPLVRQVLPDRHAEFIEQYRLDKRKEVSWLSYTISDYLIGLQITRGFDKTPVFDTFTSFSAKFQHQLTILSSCADRIDSALANIEGLLQAELFDDALAAARELQRKKHLRAAGTLAGVTLERHLATVATRRAIQVGKKDPTIADLNEALKREGVLDIPNWRFIQRLADLRNLSAHAKDREPTSDEVEELIGGIEKTIKTVF